MQFTTLAVALGLSSAALGAAVNNLTPGINIRAKDAPVATSLTVSQSPAESADKRDLEKDSNCFGTFLTFTNPGIQDFNTVAPNINDQISSYRCN
ncbi:hypothetical protein N0V90_002144 [Kalmusia sp. IMI 367209]|nr:hypothetical protein N0V90_002144 [Kalmusia sp. IMI 367209]